MGLVSFSVCLCKSTWVHASPVTQILISSSQEEEGAEACYPTLPNSLPLWILVYQYILHVSGEAKHLLISFRCPTSVEGVEESSCPTPARSPLPPIISPVVSRALAEEKPAVAYACYIDNKPPRSRVRVVLRCVVVRFDRSVVQFVLPQGLEHLSIGRTPARISFIVHILGCRYADNGAISCPP
jgi:hypothetical protein